jgi:hypothetical protein
MLALILGLLVLGFASIVFNYLNLVPGGTSTWYLIGGLVLIAAGGVTATRYR